MIYVLKSHGPSNKPQTQLNELRLEMSKQISSEIALVIELSMAARAACTPAVPKPIIIKGVLHQ